jgi:predicted MPP superfamily phosphohydrolase
VTLQAQLVFLAVVLGILALIHAFIAAHLWFLLPEGSPRWALVILLVVLGTAYIVGRALERVSMPAAVPFLQLGSWWFGVMTYLFLGCLLLDVAILAHCVIPWIPQDRVAAGRIYFLGLGLAITVALGVGFFNVARPHLRHWKLPGDVPLKIAVASDVHLSALVPPSRLRRIVDLLMQQQPDLIVFPGDLVDEDLASSAHGQQFREILRGLHAPLGVYAVTGNHEWITGADAAVTWMESCGITVLRDRAIDLGPCVVAGREDVARPRFGGGKAMPLDAILRGIDGTKPLIVLDHQPLRLREAAEAGAALVLCGHTHHGQFWPFQWITQRLFEVSWGHKKIGATDVVVSCGAGAWGPQIRTNSRSEVLLVEWGSDTKLQIRAHEHSSDPDRAEMK